VITKQIISNENVPVAVVLDYNEYIELENIKDDFNDYFTAVETLKDNKVWTKHEDMIKMLENEN
jgi:hypothetical protein